MRHHHICLGLLALTSFAGQSVSARDSYQQRAHKRQFDSIEVSYIRAALLASGTCCEKQQVRCETIFKAHAASLRRVCAQQRSDQRARIIHEYLHEHVLARYLAGADDLAAALEMGDYNCVTAAILWAALAQQVDLTIEAVERPGHVLCQVHTPHGVLLFEPTLERWSPVRLPTPERASKSSDQFRVVTRWQLLALLPYNRATKLVAEQDYSHAIIANLAALWHDPGHLEARQNLAASANDWALSLARSGRSAEGYTILRAAQFCMPESSPLERNVAYLQRRFAKVITENVEAAIFGADFDPQ